MVKSDGVDMTGTMPVGQYMALVASVRYLQATLETVPYNELPGLLGVKTPQDQYALRGFINALVKSLEPAAVQLAHNHASAGQTPDLKLVQGDVPDEAKR